MAKSGEGEQTGNAETQRVQALVSKLRGAMTAILRHEPVALSYLHGSAASGYTTALSDVDIALLVDETLTHSDQLKLMLRVAREVDDVYGITNSDVRVINEAPLVFQGKIVTDGILLYARSDRERVAYEERTRLRYFDFLPTHRRLQDAFLADVEEHGLHGRPRQS